MDVVLQQDTMNLVFLPSGAFCRARLLSIYPVVKMYIPAAPKMLTVDLKFLDCCANDPSRHH